MHRYRLRPEADQRGDLADYGGGVTTALPASLSQVLALTEPEPEPRVTPWPRVSDVLLALVATGALGAFSLRSADLGGASDVASVALVLQCLVLLLLRRWPAFTCTLVMVAVLGHNLLGVHTVAADVLVPLALYVTAARRSGWLPRTLLGAALAGSLVLPLRILQPSRSFSGDVTDYLLQVTVLAAICLMAWGAGLVRAARAEQTRLLAERAARLEAERDALATAASHAERTRVAREMHDIVAHSLSVIIAQADGGRYAAPHRPEAAQEALTTIAETGRAALADMRTILGVLRDPDSGEDVVERLPQPVDADLDELVSQVRQAGIPVSVVRLGSPRPLPPGAGVTLHRICQEALTNVIKHAGPAATATVIVQWQDEAVVIRVEDTGRGAAAASDTDGRGQGLVGMHERASMFSGAVETGPAPTGGYRVRVMIPLPGRRVPGPARTGPPTPSVRPDAVPAAVAGHRRPTEETP